MNKYRTKIPFTKQITGYITVEVECSDALQASDLLSGGFGQVVDEIEESREITHDLNVTQYIEEL